LTSALHGVE